MPNTNKDGQTKFDSQRWILILLIVSLSFSLFLRLYALDAYLTVDEPNWHTRSAGFLQALRQGNLEATYQSEHPGVMTMWSGVAGIYLSSLFDPPGAAAVNAEGHVFEMDELQSGSGVPRLTVWARAVIAVVTWLAICAIFLLLRQAIDQGAAALATILVALDPFFLFHSRVHHLDGLLTAFCALAMASLLIYRVRRKEDTGHANWYLALSGAMAGLALASKTTAIVLIPWALLSILLTGLTDRGDRQLRWSRIARDGILWLSVLLLVFLAVWPATWVALRETALRLWKGTASQALNPHENSNFFWFQKRDDPGVAFYPVAWAFRTTPLVMLGVGGPVCFASRSLEGRQRHGGPLCPAVGRCPHHLIQKVRPLSAAGIPPAGCSGRHGAFLSAGSHCPKGPL